MSLLGITKIARLRPNWTVYVLPRLTYVYLSINGLGGIYVVITGLPDHLCLDGPIGGGKGGAMGLQPHLRV